MRIGILTYHFGTNFGGQLQCYALMRTIEKLGHTVTIINYTPNNDNINIKTDIINSCRILKYNLSFNGLRTALFHLMYSKKMRMAFQNFKNNKLHIGEECTLVDFTQKYKDIDAIIVGSDQVWAPAHHKSGAYFLNFNPQFKGRKISYAPCCAINRIDKENKAQLKKLLSEFDYVSVRNTETQYFVHELTGTVAPIVADPTLLYKFDEFSSYKTPKGKYIVVYILGEEICGGHKQTIEKIRKEYGKIPVYVVSLTSSKPKYFSWADKTFWALDPEDWVSFIKNATFLYTDSFHGTVFAMKFHIPFIAYYAEEARASRFIDLKQRYKIDNIINSIENIENIKQLQPNFDMIDKNNEAFIDKSIKYLKEALQ